MGKKDTALLYNLKMELVGQIRKNQQICVLKGMSDIAQENQMLLGTPLAAFMFGSRWYTYPYNLEMPGRTQGISRVLDMSLMPKVIELLNPDYNEDMVVSHITHMLGNAIVLARNVDCLKKLLPSGVHFKCSDELRAAYDGDPLSQEEVDDFNNKNQTGKAALCTFYMTELLLAKVGY